MKALNKAAIITFGAAAAFALTVGFGGVDVSPAGGATTPHAVSSTAPVRHDTAAPAGQVVHAATLTGCIDGANC